MRFVSPRSKLGNARERYLVACQWCGSERVKADSVTVLSVLYGAVPAHRLLPPSLRREQGAGACVCVAVCHSGRTHSHEKQSVLLKTCSLFAVCCLTAPVDILTKTGAFFVFLGGYEAPRAADPTGDNKRKAPGDTKHGMIR